MSGFVGMHINIVAARYVSAHPRFPTEQPYDFSAFDMCIIHMANPGRRSGN